MADTYNSAIRRFEPATGELSTVATGLAEVSGIVVVDDSWRYPGLRRNHRAKELKIFQSVGPCRPGVTSTDVFFY